MNNRFATGARWEWSIITSKIIHPDSPSVRHGSRYPVVGVRKKLFFERVQSAVLATEINDSRGTLGSRIAAGQAAGTNLIISM